MKRTNPNKHLKIILIILILGLLFISLLSFYNQNKVAAQEIIICDREIPIGEAMDKTYDVLVELAEEHQRVYEAIPKQVEQANEMVELAGQCGAHNCIPFCAEEGGSFFEEIFEGVECVAHPCLSWLYQIGLAEHEHDACPTVPINKAFNKEKGFAYSEEEKEKVPFSGPPKILKEGEEPEKEIVYGGVIGSSGNIIALIKGKDTLELEIKGKDTTEFLDKDRDGKEEIDKTVPVEENIRLKDEPEDKKITRISFINRKLNRAREEFNKCALTPLEISALTIDEEWPRVISPTATVAEKRFQVPERVKKECLEVCGEKSEKEELGASISEIAKEVVEKITGGETAEDLKAKRCFECIYKSLLNYYCCH